MRIPGFTIKILGIAVSYVFLLLGVLIAIDSFIPRSNPVEFGFLLVQFISSLAGLFHNPSRSDARLLDASW